MDLNIFYCNLDCVRCMCWEIVCDFEKWVVGFMLIKGFVRICFESVVWIGFDLRLGNIVRFVVRVLLVVNYLEFSWSVLRKMCLRI